jgi:glycerol 2-dehydrogenase (NADP+)
MEEIDSIHKKPGMHRQLFEGSIVDTEKGGVFGWTYEQLGWNLDKKGHWID